MTTKRLNTAACSSMFLYSNSAAAIPLCLVAISRFLEISYTQAGLLSLALSSVHIPMLLLSIPLAAVLGKIRPLKWALWMLGLGLILFTRVSSFAMAMLIILVMAVGQAVIEALLTPLIEDLFPNDDGTHQAKLHMFWPIGTVFASLVIGESLSRGVSWQTIFLALGITCAAAGWLYPRHVRLEKGYSHADFSRYKKILANPFFRIMAPSVMLAGGAEGGIVYWAASYIQIQYGATPRSGGTGMALFAAGMVLGRGFTSRYASVLGLRRILYLGILLALTGGTGLYFAQSAPVFFVFLTLSGAAIAPFWPGLQTRAVRLMGEDPTTTMTFLSCFGLFGSSSAVFLMGMIGDMGGGLHTSLLSIPIILLLLLSLLIWEAALTRKLKGAK